MKPTPDLAAAVVAWHNRHPLALRLSAPQVMGIGVVALPFWSPDAAPLTDRADAVFPAAPAFNGASLPPDTLDKAPVGLASGASKAGKLRQAVAAATGRLFAPLARRLKALAGRRTTSKGPTSVDRSPLLRSSFSEDFIAPLSPRQVADFALRQGSAARPGAPEWPQRDVLPDAGTPASVPVVRFVHSAAIEVGRARSRVLIGVGPRPQVIGQRLMSRARLMGAAGGAAALLLVSLVGVLKLSHPTTEGQHGPQLATAPHGASASASASAAASSPQAPAHAASGHLVVLTADAASAAPADGVASASAGAASAVRAAASAPERGHVTEAMAAASAPVQDGAQGEASARNIRPELSPEARDAARQQSNDLRQAKAAQAASSPAAHETKGHAYAVATIPTRTRAGSQLRLVLMGAPEIPKAGEAHAEVMQVAEGWRAVMWPFASREAAETVRNMFASRGIKAEVIEF